MAPRGTGRQGYHTLRSVIAELQTAYPYDKSLYRQRHKVGNLLAKPKDWRRIATRYDRCAYTFSAICVAATVIFWL